MIVFTDDRASNCYQETVRKDFIFLSLNPSNVKVLENLTIVSLLKLFIFQKHQRNLIPLLNSAKINKAFHGLALARALVSVLYIVASNAIFGWGIVTTRSFGK